jgi:hypothetical protein
LISDECTIILQYRYIFNFLLIFLKIQHALISDRQCIFFTLTLINKLTIFLLLINVILFHLKEIVYIYVLDLKQVEIGIFLPYPPRFPNIFTVNIVSPYKPLDNKSTNGLNCFFNISNSKFQPFVPLWWWLLMTWNLFSFFYFFSVLYLLFTLKIIIFPILTNPTLL